MATLAAIARLATDRDTIDIPHQLVRPRDRQNPALVAGDDRTADSADRSAYPRLKLPVAILWGDKDSTTPLEQAHDLQKLLPRAALTVLPGLGHIPQIGDPEAFNSALLTALGKL